MNLHLDLMRFTDFLKIKREGGKRWIFDPIRRKWLVLQPEEMIRQLVLHFLVEEKRYNLARISMEKRLKINSLDKRFDLLVYSQDLRPFLLVECKAPQVPIGQDVFRQASWYNLPLKVRYILVTNGIETYCCAMDYERQEHEFLTEVPDFV
jgi:hypothetical protein